MAAEAPEIQPWLCPSRVFQASQSRLKIAGPGVRGSPGALSTLTMMEVRDKQFALVYISHLLNPNSNLGKYFRNFEEFFFGESFEIKRIAATTAHVACHLDTVSGD